MDVTEKALESGGTAGADARVAPAHPDGPIAKSTGVERVGEAAAETREERLAALLVERGKFSEIDYARVKRIRQDEGAKDGFVSLLIRLGMVAEHDVAHAFADMLGIPLAASADYGPAPSSFEEAVSVRFLKQHRVAPIAQDGDRIIVAMADPCDDYAAESLELALGRPITRWVGIPSEIDAAIERLSDNDASATSLVVGEVEADEAVSAEDIEQLKDMASEVPVIRLVNVLFQRALKASASDIHIEPFENRLKVRFRIDGVLREVESPPAKLAPAIVSRIKIMAKLNIAERRLPQDGRINLRVQGKELDVRVSAMPTLYGESVVMRLLNRGDVVLELASIGFAEDTTQRFLDVLKRPNGMVLVTGPTGSGKTTTLYTALNLINTPERKIITAEDPIEYQLEGVNQIQVKPAIGLTFANALRSIVRQDPDVIMVGELRDTETAQICIQSALTGHLVFSTLHTNDAASSVTRLLDMGVEAYLLTSTLNAVIGQRLARILCTECRERYSPPAAFVKQLQAGGLKIGRRRSLYRAVGCEACNETGYRGRTAIQEMLVMNEDIRQLVLAHADAQQIHELARKQGMRTMSEDGWLKALNGITSVEEISRVI